jgi:hypothetical protein
MMNVKSVITPHYLSTMAMFTDGNLGLAEALVGASELIEKQAAELKELQQSKDGAVREAVAIINAAAEEIAGLRKLSLAVVEETRVARKHYGGTLSLKAVMAIDFLKAAI